MALCCLQCGRVFAKVAGEVEPGGYLLCRSCGAVAVWTKEMTLRELTAKEHTDAGANFELMRERAKIVPSRSVQASGSWAMTCLMILIVSMVVLERIGVVAPIHPKPKPFDVVPEVHHHFGP